MASTKNYICSGMIRTNIAVNGSTRLYIVAGIPRQFTVPGPGGGSIINQLQKNNLGADLYNGSLI